MKEISRARKSEEGDITCRVVDRLVLSHEGLCDSDGHASEDSLLGVDEVPDTSVCESGLSNGLRHDCVCCEC